MFPLEVHTGTRLREGRGSKLAGRQGGREAWRKGERRRQAGQAGGRFCSVCHPTQISLVLVWQTCECAGPGGSKEKQHEEDIEEKMEKIIDLAWQGRVNGKNKREEREQRKTKARDRN